jgi:hypothetical protein
MSVTEWEGQGIEKKNVVFAPLYVRDLWEVSRD